MLHGFFCQLGLHSSYCNKFISSAMMESYYFKSVVSLVDSTRSRKSRELSPSPTIRVPSLAPVFHPQKLTDFSISRILGLENETHQGSTCSAPVQCRYPIQAPSPRHSYSDTSPRLSLCSDNASSTSDCDSEPDQVSTHSKQPARKKRQRTIFSPMEVWELERTYMRRPYLMSEDEKELVQRLGITAKSLKYCFQNRRAKTRREDSKVTSVYQTSSSNQFGRPVRRGVPSEKPQFLIQSPPDRTERMSYPALKNHLEVPPRRRPIRADYHYSSFKSNQLRGHSSLQVPMFHPDQFKRRPAESARSYSSGLHRYQPY